MRNTENVGVYGLGRFGMFWSALLARHYTVLAYNRTPCDPPPGVQGVTLKRLGECDTIFLCVAISALEEVLTTLSPLLRRGGTVIDTCSVKLFPVRLMRQLLPSHTKIIGSHPLFGPDSAVDGVRGLPLALCRVRGAAEADGWERRFAALGIEVTRITPSAHDRAMAEIQGVTHFVGRLLASLELKPSPLATTGYHRLLQVMEQTCSDSYRLFIDLQRLNPYTSTFRGRLNHNFVRLLREIDNTDTKG